MHQCQSRIAPSARNTISSVVEKNKKLRSCGISPVHTTTDLNEHRMKPASSYSLIFIPISKNLIRKANPLRIQETYGIDTGSLQEGYRNHTGRIQDERTTRVR
jgi:hypothetical protein